MTLAPDQQGWYRVESGLTSETIQELVAVSPVEKLSLTHIPLVTVELAKRLTLLPVEWLWLWCNVTRPAMKYIVQIPELRTLDVLNIRGPGQLANFKKARHLEVFRAHHCMTAQDLLQVAQCAGLREIGAQNAELTFSVISAFLALPNLTALDLESTRFDDKMAKRLCRSKTITSLDLGATRITRTGLEHIVLMTQLRSLDLWATDLNEADLRLLSNLPHIEYLSLGNYDGLPSLDSDAITSLILDLPSLKRVWLDGVRLEANHRKALESKLESLRVTSFGDCV